jgi:hypothetical protein
MKPENLQEACELDRNLGNLKRARSVIYDSKPTHQLQVVAGYNFYAPGPETRDFLDLLIYKTVLRLRELGVEIEA